MSTFFIILFSIYLICWLYFNIDSKIVGTKRYEEDIKFRNKDKLIEEEINVLTTRLGELSTDLRNSQYAYAELKKKYLEKELELEELKKNKKEE